MNIFSNLQKFKNNIALIDEKLEKITYLDLLNNSEKITFDNKNKAVILIESSNSIDFIIAYVASIRSDNVVILVERLSQNFNEYLKKFKPRYIITERNQSSLKNYKKKNIIGNYNFYEKKIIDNYILNKNLSLLLSTSGSLGSPKFVKISRQNLLNNTIDISKALKISKKDRCITTLIPSYTYGMSLINTHLFSGSSIVMCPFSIIEKNFWSLLSKSRATTFGGVPIHYEIIKKLKVENLNFSCIKYLSQAGGKLNKATFEYIVKELSVKKIKFIPMYGATEATSRMSIQDWKLSKKKIYSIGKPIGKGEFHIIGENNKIIKDKMIEGELVFKGKNIFCGYIQDFKGFEKLESRRLLYTGDLAFKDKFNNIIISGRKSRFVKIDGHRVDLDYLEQIIEKNRINCVCIGKDELVNIIYENKINLKKILNILKKFKKINLKHFKFKCMDKIPLLPSGKKNYSLKNV